MKKLYIILTSLWLGIGASQAQVYLPNRPDVVSLPPSSNVFLDASSKYDTQNVGSNNKGKGLVFPQVDLRTFEFDITTPDGAEILPTFYDGMVVYNTGKGSTISNALKGGIQVEVEPGFYYFSNPNGRANLSVQSGKWIRFGSGSSATTQYLTTQYVGSTGVWMQNIPTKGNTISFKVTNQSSASFAALNFQNALTLNGASQGLSYTPAADYTNVALAGGQSQTLVYNISGTPLSYGTLTANFSAMGGSVTAFGTIQIQEQSAVKALSVELLGNYISNKALTAENKVRLVVHNFSNQPVSNTNLSQVLSLTGIDGVSIVPNQNTSVSIPVGGEVTLDYSLQGAPVKEGNLVAAFNPNTVVSGNANTTKVVSLFSNATASNLQIQGDYVVNQAMAATNQVTLTLTNNNPYELVHLNAKDALSLSGSYQNMSVAPNQNTDFNIPANGTKTLTYTLAGEPNVGGPFTATWSQAPFGSVSANKTVAQFYVSPTTFYFSANQSGSGTITVNSSEPWQYEVLDANWITVTGATGQSGNGTITFTTQPHTSATPEIGFIRIYRADGNGVKVALRQPPTDDLTTNIPTGYNIGIPERYNFSINGETKDYTVTYNGDWSVLSYPDWVQSATKVGSSTLRITSKAKTDIGIGRIDVLKLTYGGGYVKEFTIAQNPKAEKCPRTVPPNLRVDKGYIVWPYKEPPSFSEVATLYEERDGDNDFADIIIGNYVRKEVAKTATKSRLFLGTYFPGIMRASGLEPSYWSAYKNENNIISPAGGTSPEKLSKYLQYENPQYPRATVVICVDGLDENTPSKP